MGKGEAERKKEVYYEIKKERGVLKNKEGKRCTMKQRSKDMHYETERRKQVYFGTLSFFKASRFIAAN